MGRAELAAIPATITHDHIHIATDSLTSEVSHSIKLGNNRYNQRSTVTMSKYTSTNTLRNTDIGNPTSSLKK